MKTRIRHSGFSLVELLIVMAIIAIIAGITIPIFAKSAFLQNSDLQNGSREVYAMLRAAKIYAVDHHVDTAVVYNLAQGPDSLNNGASVTVGVGMFVARGLHPKERRALNLSETEARNVFIRVRDSEGEYNPLTDGTCILNIANNGTPGSQPGEWEVGVNFVRVYDSDDDGLNDPQDKVMPVLPVAGKDNDLFPAHIFTPSGLMASSRNIPTQAVRLKVAPIPSSDPLERAATDASGEIVYLDINNDGTGDVPDYRYIGVEIKPSLGRVKIASDEDTLNEA